MQIFSNFKSSYFGQGRQPTAIKLFILHVWGPRSVSPEPLWKLGTMVGIYNLSTGEGETEEPSGTWLVSLANLWATVSMKGSVSKNMLEKQWGAPDFDLWTPHASAYICITHVTQTCILISVCLSILCLYAHIYLSIQVCMCTYMLSLYIYTLYLPCHEHIYILFIYVHIYTCVHINKYK